MSEEWEKFNFEVGKGDSRELNNVRHIVHVPSARRIIQE